jgi:hypothetical protein
MFGVTTADTKTALAPSRGTLIPTTQFSLTGLCALKNTIP